MNAIIIIIIIIITIITIIIIIIIAIIAIIIIIMIITTTTTTELVINWSVEVTAGLGTRLSALWNRSAGDCLLDAVLQVLKL